MLIFRRISQPLFAVWLVPSVLGGCHRPTKTVSLVGRWHGTSQMDRISTPVDEQFWQTGAATVTLRVPQGRLVSGGTWSRHGGIFTQMTTTRAVEIAGQRKEVPLANPFETVYHCTLTGDRLTLTRPEASETVVLVRETSP